MTRIGLIFLMLFCMKSYAQTLGRDVVIDDTIYEENIKSVFLYPKSMEEENPARLINQPVIPLNGDTPLVLEFDDLTADFRGFRAKLVHCTADWQQSALSEIEYTTSYNDYPLTEYFPSFSTKVPYYHYRFQVPEVKISGNYLLIVISEDKRKPVLTLRFMVYEPKVRIGAVVNFATGTFERNTHQQVDFSIDHKGLAVPAPQNDLKVVIRQNFRWDTSKTNFKPTQVNSFDQSVKYQFFNLENAFPGGNEFRYFDSRTIAARGFGVYEIERLDEFTRLILAPDKARNQERINFSIDDLNGRYTIDHRESGNGSVEADYTPVVFTLQIPETTEGEIYVNGGFNLWQLNDLNRMEYHEGTKAYQAVILLKQGLVNYNYRWVKDNRSNNEEALLEGNFSSTENDYDMLVYYRAPAGRYDQLVGYSQLEFNRRN